ncbi:MAG: ferritin-like domain-containing protein [Pseudomonadota bacterium]
MQSVASAIRDALLTGDPRAKCFATRSLVRRWRKGELAWEFDVSMPDQPAWPAQPQLLPPAQMPKRGKFGSERGRIALWHSLAHIEFVAIDLALDMAGRFGAQMGEEFVDDFLYVAADEAMHFALLARKLESLGSFYGALPAHAGLWQAAYETRNNVAARLAIVPMVLEARGLDVTPATLERVNAAGDEGGSKILSRILDDEIRHVGFGTKHFLKVAEQAGERPETLWKSLVRAHFRGAVKPPFNDSARLEAGLSPNFYEDVAN